jgi:hypothetical protein
MYSHFQLDFKLKTPIDFPTTVVIIHVTYYILISHKKIWCNGIALGWNAGDCVFEPARFFSISAPKRQLMYCQM